MILMVGSFHDIFYLDQAEQTTCRQADVQASLSSRSFCSNSNNFCIGCASERNLELLTCTVLQFQVSVCSSNPMRSCLMFALDMPWRNNVQAISVYNFQWAAS